MRRILQNNIFIEHWLTAQERHSDLVIITELFLYTYTELINGKSKHNEDANIDIQDNSNTIFCTLLAFRIGGQQRNKKTLYFVKQNAALSLE